MARGGVKRNRQGEDRRHHEAEPDARDRGREDRGAHAQRGHDRQYHHAARGDERRDDDDGLDPGAGADA
jgi:hypothetical protein